MKPRDELTLDEIRRFFQRSNRFVWIDVTGGEVSLRKDFPAICEAIITNCRDLLLLHFPTNGYLTDKIVQYTREITRMGLEKLIITVSTDGDEAMNDRIRGVDGGWRRQMETFRRLRELPGVHVVLGMTLSAANVDHFPQAFAAAQREVPGLGYRDFHVNIVHESEHYLGNTDLRLRAQVAPEALVRATDAVARLRGLGWSPVDYLERAYLKRVPRYLETGRTPMRCHALRASCFIDSWGHVYPCTIYDRKLGSLRETEDRQPARIGVRPRAHLARRRDGEGAARDLGLPMPSVLDALRGIPEHFGQPRPTLGAVPCGRTGPGRAG